MTSEPSGTCAIHEETRESRIFTLVAHQAPVLVVGMHNSGTSILAEIIHSGGIFLHANMAHNESRFFSIRINDSIILKDPNAWARLPLISIDEVMSHGETVEAIIRRDWLRTYTDDGYDGRGRWGFKDPRLCLVLPLYLELFRDATVVYIQRNPDVVARSLASKKKRGVGVLSDEAHWKKLASEYTNRAQECLRGHPNHFVVQYEELCTRPADTCRELFDFLHLPMNDSVRHLLENKVHSDRIG